MRQKQEDRYPPHTCEPSAFLRVPDYSLDGANIQRSFPIVTEGLIYGLQLNGITELGTCPMC